MSYVNLNFKFDTGTDEKKAKELGPIIDKFYENNLKNPSNNFPEFYRGVCEIVEYLPLFIFRTINLPNVNGLPKKLLLVTNFYDSMAGN